MSERDGYAPGVPCWVDTWRADPEAAAAFYEGLFGWRVEKLSLPWGPGKVLICRLRGRDVAAIAAQPPDAPPTAWNTHICVASADDAAADAERAGGRVVVEPFDNFDTGRMAVLADPEGAVFCVWQARELRGAELVNEPGAWSMSALNTRAPERAKAFYGAVFGWEADAFDLGGLEVTLLRLPGYVGGEPEQPVPRDVIATMAPIGGEQPEDVPAHWSVDFWVGDIDATVAKAGEFGGRVIVPPYEIPGTPLRQAVLADSDGAAFSVSRVTVGD